MRFVRLTTADTVREPVRVDDLVDFGRLGIVDRPDRLEALIRAARTKVERFAGVILVPGTFLVRIDRWATVFDLPLRPITGVQAFRWTDEGGVVTTLTSGAYLVDLQTEASRVVLSRDVATPTNLRPIAGVELEVTAGYSTPDAIPEDLRQIVLRAALMAFEHRNDPTVLRQVDDYIESAAMAVAAGELV